MKKILLIALFITGICFGQNEIIHISKTHQDGTPKEVIIYKRLNNDLQSNNPFEVVNKISYDSKGNWLRPKLTGTAKKTELIIIGSWFYKDDDDYIKFNKDGTLEIYDGNELEDTGEWFLTQIDDIIYINLIGGKNTSDDVSTIEILNKNRIIIDGERIIQRISN